MPATTKQLVFLAWQLASREAVGRYRGSVMGLAWAFLSPLIMLAIYTFVFSVIFQVRWGAGEENRAVFALNLYAGIIVHAIFAESLNRATGLLRGNVNFIKKVVFPLWILPIVVLAGSVYHAAISLLVLLLAGLVVTGALPITAIALPLVLLPFLLLVLGGAWIIAALGVYLRDIAQLVPVVTMAAMFLAPVFYPAEMIPADYRQWLLLNPLTFVIEQTRGVLLQGVWPDFAGLLEYSAAAALVAIAGYGFFRRLQRGFADVV